MPEIIVLDEGEFRNFGTLGDGEEFTDKIIDCSADGAAFKCNAVGDGWRIANIGVIGSPDLLNTGRHGDFLFNVECPDGGEGVIERLFVDFRHPDRKTGMGATRLRPGHRGTVRMRNTFIAGTGNNASYASSAGKNGSGGGRIVYENCYHRDNVPANYRPGTRNSVIRDCVSVADDPDGLRGRYPGGGGDKCRGAWVKHCPDQLIENVSFYHTDRDINTEYIEARYICDKSDCDGVVVDVQNCHFLDSGVRRFNERVDGGCGSGRSEINDNGGHTDSPLIDVLGDGVPVSPEMAANGAVVMPPGAEDDFHFPMGGFDDVPDDDFDVPDYTRLAISTDEERVDYEFVVQGEISEYEGIGVGDEIEDLNDGRMRATGFVRGGEDAYRYAGCIESVSFSQEADLSVSRDGSAVDLADVVECPPEDGGTGDTDEPVDEPDDTDEPAIEVGENTLTVTNGGSGETVYRAHSDHEITTDDGGGVVTEVDGGYEIDGVVNGDAHNYTLSGPLLAFEYEGPAPYIVCGPVAYPGYDALLDDGSGETDMVPLMTLHTHEGDVQLYVEQSDYDAFSA